jgi:hypothetical protein
VTRHAQKPRCFNARADAKEIEHSEDLWCKGFANLMTRKAAFFADNDMKTETGKQASERRSRGAASGNDHIRC